MSGQLFIPGTPIPQGSTKAFMPKGGRFPVVTSDNPKTKPWRADVAGHVRGAIGPGIVYPDGPVSVGCVFVMPRRAAEPKRVTPPHTRKPDLDKLLRAVLDALSGLVFTDDSQVNEFHRAGKRTAAIGEQPGLDLSWGRP